MTYKTHFIGGICTPIMLSTVMPIENIAVVAGVSAFSALLPDIDIEGSKVHNKAGIVGKGVTSIFSHRGFIHTPILYVFLYALMSMVLPQAICLGFLIGTISHLVLDTFNYKGIMWMYPFSRKHFHIASIKTRTFSESVFTVLMIVATVVLSANDIVSASAISDMFSLYVPEFSVPEFSISEFSIPEFSIPEFSNIQVNTVVEKCQMFVKEVFTF